MGEATVATEVKEFDMPVLRDKVQVNTRLESGQHQRQVWPAVHPFSTLLWHGNQDVT